MDSRNREEHSGSRFGESFPGRGLPTWHYTNEYHEQPRPADIARELCTCGREHGVCSLRFLNTKPTCAIPHFTRGRPLTPDLMAW